MTPPQVEYRIIELTQGQVAYVSPDKLERLSAFKWMARWCPKGKHFYAISNIRTPDGKRHTIYMAREILGLKFGNPLTGDHVDRTRTLDNTDKNLRIASQSQQKFNQGAYAGNKSGYKGVCFHKATGKWVAQIQLNGKRKHLGLFDTKEEAYAAYCEAAKKNYGEFASFS